MSCENNINKYIDIVEDLIKLNPSVYNNFDNAAKFVLKSKLTPEQKKLSIHHFAHIYSKLSEVDEVFYNQGKSTDVINANTLLDSNSAYIKFASDLFSEKSLNDYISKEELEKSIDALRMQNFIDQEEIFNLISKVKTFFNLNSFESLENRIEYRDELKNMTKDIIGSMGKIKDNPSMKQYLFELVDEGFDLINSGSKYVEIDEAVQKYANLDNQLVLLKDGTLVEAVIDYNSGDKTALKMLMPDGTLKEINPDDIVSQKSSRIVNVDYGNQGEQIFDESEILSGLSFRAVDPAESGTLKKELSKISAPASAIRFFAVKNNGSADARINRMKALAADESEYEMLANREHETFENPAQVNKLKSNPSARVLGVSRPKMVDSPFSIMGNIIGTDIMFYVYSHDNYAFVDADNTTKLVDFTSPNDLYELKNLSLKRTKNGLESLSENDLRLLSDANINFQNFKTLIESKITSSSEQSTDVTKEFFESYDLYSKRDSSQKTLLADQLAKDKTLGKRVKIVTLDDEQNVLSSKDVLLPFHIRKTIKQNGDVSYSLVSSLGSNQFIAYQNEDGEVQYISQQVYAEEVLNYEKVAKDLFKEEDFKIKEEVQRQLKTNPTGKINQSKLVKTNNFILRFKDNRTSYAIVQPVKPISSGEVFVNYITNLSNAISNPGKSSAVTSFERNLFSFKPALHGPMGYMLTFSLATGKPISIKKGGTGVGNLQVEIRPHSKLRGTNHPYAQAINANSKSNFNFPINEAVIMGIQESLVNSKEVRQAIEKNPVLKQFDLKTMESIEDFYKTVYSIKMDQTGNETIENLVNFVEKELLERFNNEITRAVVNPLKKKQKGNPAFYQQLEKDATLKGEYAPEILFFDVDTDGTLTPKVDIGNRNASTKDSFNTSLRNLNVITASPRKVSVSSKRPAATSVQDVNKVNNAGLKEKEDQVKPTVDSNNISVDSSQEKDLKDKTEGLLESRRDNLANELQQVRLEADKIINFLNQEDPLSERSKAAEQMLRDLNSREDQIELELRATNSEINKLNSEIDDDVDDVPDIDEDDRFKISPYSDDIAQETSTTIQSEISFLSEILPQFGVELNGIQDVVDLAKIDGRVLGLFKDRVIYLNDNLKVKGVVFHEAFHGVFRYLMTASERASLINAVMSDPKHTDKFSEDNLIEFARVRKMEYNPKKIAELIAEEVLADGFQKYMSRVDTKKAPTPRNVFQKLYDLIRRLIKAFVANRAVIENTYDKISSGYYKNAVINSGMFDGEVAYEIIPGPKKYISYYGTDSKITYELNTSDQNQLVDMVVGELLKDGSKDSFDEKFDNASNKIIDTIYNLDLIINQSEETKNNSLLILEKYGERFNAYRFMLGARMKGKIANDLNATGKTKYDNKVNKNIYIDPITKEKVDNTNGNYSYEILKKLVKEKYDKAVITDLVRSGTEEHIVNANELEKMTSNDGNGSKVNDPKASIKDELDGSGDFDVTVGNVDVLDSYVSQVRRFLSTIRRDSFDEETGATIPRMIDGQHLFTGLVKITSNLSSDKIIESIKTISEIMMSDGYTETALDLKGVYDEIVNITKLDNGDPVDKNMYNMLVEALHNTELNYAMFNVTLPVDPSEENRKGIPYSFRLIDKVVEEDARTKRDQALTSMMLSHSRNASNENYRAAKDALIELSEKLVREATQSSNILTSTKGQSFKLNDLTNKIHENMQILGIAIPKSLVKLSLIAIQDYENKAPINKLTDEEKSFYETNMNFVRESKYLELDFFRSLPYLLKAMYQGQNVNPAFTSLIDDQTTKSFEIKRFMSILKKASAYSAKYDPTMIPSVIKNAEGKSIYRFSKYNPMAQTVQRVRQLGIDEAFSDERFYSMIVDTGENSNPIELGLRQFYLDNHKLGKALRDENSNEAKRVKLFLKNFDTALFGGVLQILGQDEYKEGNVFKDIDERSLYVLNILSFLSRKKIVDKDGVEINMYNRSFHQLEATQTNFLVSSLHTPFVSLQDIKKGSILEREGKVMYKGKYLKIVEDLQATVEQEFYRIQREWATRNIKKENYDSGKKNQIINNYSGVLNSDGISANVDSENLRAYNFKKLSDFFDQNPTLKEKYLAFAKGDALVKDSATEEEVEVTSFDQLKDDIELLEALDAYAKQTYQNHLDRLVHLGVIEKNVEESKTTNVPTVYYTSKMLPTFMKDDSVKTVKNKIEKREISLDSVYPKSAGSNSVVESVLFDHFMNYWSNALAYNELIDGDIAMNVKNDQDYVKRLKKVVASGSNMKQGFHKVAVMNTIQGFIDDNNPQYGPYYSRNEIIYDQTVPAEIKEEILRNYDATDRSSFSETYDGQSQSLLMHHMDMLESIGRLDEKAKDIIIAKHYRQLTEKEIKYLKSLKIVLNPKKTVTAGVNVYNKLSESYMDRLDVSYLVLPQNATAREAQEVYDKIHSLYLQIYDARKQIQELKIIGASPSEINLLESDITNLASKVQAYFMPLPHRKKLHHMLNSMEYYNVDQVMDTSATKNAHLLPVSVIANEKSMQNLSSDGYLRLDLSADYVPNRHKYMQVETSGVKESAKVSVQKKLLIAADIHPDKVLEVLEAEATADNPLTFSERLAVEELATAFNNYKETLNDVASSRLSYFKNVLREGDNIKLGKIFDLIRENLEAQGAGLQLLNYFKTDPVSGKPVFSPNLPIVRKTLEYYFMSQYSKNVTDEKASGFKNFHESSYGYDVLYDSQTGEVIRTEQIKMNPALYSDSSRYSTRPLGVNIEIDPKTGLETYWVEAIMPMPAFENSEHKSFWLANMTKMFGTRIPTEDKRSMIAIKVVDFVDSAKSNSVIVPHFIHLLSGSDFDIDSLFGQMMSSYRDKSGTYHMYGDYSGYRAAAPDTAKQYIEFLHFMSKNSEFRDLINKKQQELKESTDFSFLETDDVTFILGSLGFTSDEISEIFVRVEASSVARMPGGKTESVMIPDFSGLARHRKGLIAVRSDIKEDYLRYVEATEGEKPATKDEWDKRKELGSLMYDLKNDIQFMERIKLALDSVYFYKAAMDVMRNYDMPSTLSEFASSDVYSKMVVDKNQNKNLEASLSILSNEAVFNRLYINQRASTEAFQKILQGFGIDLKTIRQKSNLYTLDNAIFSKVENQMNKEGIGITAVMNKFLALASQYDLKLNSKNVVWDYNNLNGDRIIKDSFANINENGDRVIALIGNILGMFADGVKDPIPAALQWDEINAGTTLAMLGIGLDPSMVAGFNFLPSVRNASDAVKQSKLALELEGENLYNATLENSLYFDNDSYIELMKKGIINMKGEIIPSRLKIGFSAKPLDLERLKANVLTPSEIGFDIRYMNDDALTNDEMETVLTLLYQKQVKQSNAIRKASSITNLFKRLNPTLTELDNMNEAIFFLEDDELSLFTESSVKRLFASDSVYNTMREMLDDMSQQASEIFLERSPFFRPLVSMFLDSFRDKRHISETITAFVGVRKFLMSYPGSRTSTNESVQNMIEKDDKNLTQTFTPEYWFVNNLESELNKLRVKYPKNEFLKFLRSKKGKATANAKINSKNYLLNEKIIKMIGKAKVKGSLADTMVDDVASLYNSTDDEARMFVKKLFYHELARTGMLSGKEGSFLQFMPPQLLSPISKSIDEFIDILKETTSKIEKETLSDSASKQLLMSNLRNFLGSDKSNQEIYDFLNDLLTQVAYSNAIQHQKGEAYVTESGRFSWYTNKTKPDTNGALANIYETLFEDVDIYDKATKKQIADTSKKVISRIFNLDLAKVKGQNSFSLDPSVVGDTINIDLTSFGENAKLENIMANRIASKMGINFDQKAESYKFPTLIKVKNSYYVYNGNEDTAGDKNMGETLINSLASGENKMTLYGFKASYVKMPSRFSGEMVSPIGFTKEDASLYEDIVSKRTEIVVKTEGDVSYKGISVKYTDDITTKTGEPGAAQYDRENNVIKINQKLLKEKFEEKAWTKPRKQKDGSYATALPLDAFSTYEQWENFVKEHEYQHTLLSKEDSKAETDGEYEDMINARVFNSIKTQPQGDVKTLSESEKEKSQQEEYGEQFMSDDEIMMLMNSEDAKEDPLNSAPPTAPIESYQEDPEVMGGQYLTDDELKNYIKPEGREGIDLNDQDNCG